MERASNPWRPASLRLMAKVSSSAVSLMLVLRLTTPGDEFNAVQDVAGSDLNGGVVGAGDGDLEAGPGRTRVVNENPDVHIFLAGKGLPHLIDQIARGVVGKGDDEAGDVIAALADAGTEILAERTHGQLVGK